MPIFEYECPNCGSFEYIQTSSEKPLSHCPTCLEKGKKIKVSRLVSPAAFHLKGTGWYKTDYSKGGATQSSAKSSSSSSSSSSDTASPAKEEKSSPKSKEKKAGSCGSSCSCH